MAVYDDSGRHKTAHLNAAAMLPARTGPLADIRIVDLTQALAGPYCTMILGDMGADIIKIEPPGGDGLRRIGPHTEVDEAHHFGGYYASGNRNKRSITLDLTTDQDRQILLRLVGTADILIENFRAGVMERLDLAYESLREINPALVYGAIRGFGDPRTGEGPYTFWPAYDVVAQSMSGLISHTGTTAGERVSSGPSVGDLYPATLLVGGVLAALHHAKQTGNGQFVDVAMMDSLMGLCESMTWRYSYTGEIQSPRGSEHPSLCPFELFDTADGQLAIAAPKDEQWDELCRVIQREELIGDDRYRSARRRVERREDVREIITSWTGMRTRAEVIEALAGRVPCGPVNNAADLFEDEHVRARQMLVAVDHPGSERPVLTPNTAVRFTETPGGVYRAAPRLDEHREEILAELTQIENSRGAGGEAP